MTPNTALAPNPEAAAAEPPPPAVISSRATLEYATVQLHARPPARTSADQATLPPLRWNPIESRSV